MRLATSTNLFSKRRDGGLHTPYLESIRRCRQAGFKTLDFSFTEFFFTRTELSGDDWESYVDEIVNESQKLGIDFSQSHLPYNPGYMPVWKSDLEKEDYYKFAHRSVLISARLGIKWMVIHPFTQCIEKEFDDEASVQYNHSFYDCIIEQALKNGVGIAYENMIEYPQRRKFSARAEELVMLVDSYNDSRIGVCWDFGHGNRLYYDESNSIKILGNRVVALHVNDNTGNSDMHFLPFMGTVGWEKTLKALKDTNYNGDFTYEIYGFTKNMPEDLKDVAAKYAYDVGLYCLSIYDRL